MKKFMLLFIVLFSLLLIACNQEEETNDEKIYIEFEESLIEIDERQEYEIKYNTNATDINWESLDESVATVENGIITAVGAGFCEIVASSGDVSASISVIVNDVKFVPTYVTLTIDGDPVEVLKNSTIYQNLFDYYGGETHIIYDDALFEGWYLDSDFTQVCDIDSFITEDISLYPKYKFIEVNCELRIDFENIVDASNKFSDTAFVQNIIPTYGTYFEIDNERLEKFTFIVVKYDVSKEDYFVSEIIETVEDNKYKIPSNGFIVAISKECEEYDTYIANLLVGEKISLSTYSALTANTMYVNEIIPDSEIDFKLDAEITTKYCTVYDVRSKQVLYSKEGDTRAWPASTTKVITAIAALKYVPLDAKHTIGDELAITFEGSDPSLCGLKVGEVWTLEQMLYGLLLPSGNDAGYGIAALTIDTIHPNNTFTAKEKIDMFAELMNEVAQECGAVNSKFYTPDGNSYYNSNGTYQDRTEYHYVTANDMVKIGVYAFSFPAICEVVRTSSKTIKLETGQSKSFSLTNSLIKSTSSYYYQGAVGLKTGTTNRAGACLVSGVERARKFIIVASLNNPTSASRYTNTLTIFKSIFK